MFLALVVTEKAARMESLLELTAYENGMASLKERINKLTQSLVEKRSPQERNITDEIRTGEVFAAKKKLTEQIKQLLVRVA